MSKKSILDLHPRAERLLTDANQRIETPVSLQTHIKQDRSEIRSLARCFVAALFACSTLLVVSNMRVVNAEDDCADPTLIVQRIPLLDQLVCIWESE